VGCSVTGNTYRHPAVLAKAAVTVDHLSGGRLEFGIGAGWAEDEHTMLGLPFGTARDRADWLEEALPIIRSLWTTPRTTFTGKRYLLADAVAEPKPVQIRVPADAAALVDQVAGFVGVGVTEIILIVAAEPVAQAERVADLLPELRGLGQGA